MWMKMAANKNKYLQKTFPKENPRVINNSLDRAFKIDPEELANHQQLGVSLKSKNGAKLKKKDEKIAFGYWGIPILLEKIQSNDSKVINEGLTKLLSEIYDSVKLVKAYKLHAITRLSKLVHFLLQQTIPNFEELLEKALDILEIFGHHLDSVKQIMDDKDFMQDLLGILELEDNQILSDKAAAVFRSITDHPSAADRMILEQVFLHQRVKEALYFQNFKHGTFYEFLANLIARQPETFVRRGYFDLLFKKLGEKNLVESDELKCAALMCNCCLGHKAADKYDMVSFFYAMLIDQQFDHDLQISAILGLKNCALTNFGQWKCREFEDLPGRLLDKCFIKNKVLQYNALEALRVISDMPSTKEYLLKTCIKKIKKIHCFSAEATKSKQQLLEWINSKPYKLSNPEP